jgi:Family of unknown function (DUF6069)
MTTTIDQFPQPIRRVLKALRVDFRPQGQPSAILVLLASLVALAGSLLADYLLIKLGTTVFPSSKGFVHFRFSDYGKLTVIGVVVACVGWPVVTRLTSTPRQCFLRLAVLVTLVLLLPDLWIWYHGEPGKSVFVLVWMHLAIALVTYNSLVRLAPCTRGRHAARGAR